MWSIKFISHLGCWATVTLRFVLAKGTYQTASYHTNLHCCQFRYLPGAVAQA